MLGASRGPAGFEGGGRRPCGRPGGHRGGPAARGGPGGAGVGRAGARHTNQGQEVACGPRAAPTPPQPPPTADGRRQQASQRTVFQVLSSRETQLSTGRRCAVSGWPSSRAAPANPVLLPGPLPAPSAPHGCSPGPHMQGHQATPAGAPPVVVQLGQAKVPLTSGKAGALFLPRPRRGWWADRLSTLAAAQPLGARLSPLSHHRRSCRSCSAPAQAPRSPRQTHE